MTFSREAAASDSEGNATGVLTEILETQATWGSPRGRDVELAASRGQIVDAVLGMETPTVEIRPGDIADVRDERWIVVQARPSQIHYRVFLRRAE